jgi:signal transduction histidine kinase/ActR/RegA family two-component response regulator
MNQTNPIWRFFFGWTDRLLPPEIKEEPLLHIRVQVGLFMTLPGSGISLFILLYCSTLSDHSMRLISPLVVGHILVWGATTLLPNPKHARLGLMSIGTMDTLMVIYACYIMGGLSIFTIAWLVALPVMLTIFAGRKGALLGAILCISALMCFWGLDRAGHSFPMAITQTAPGFVLSVGWCIVTTSAISIFSLSRFERTVSAYQSEIDRRTKIEQTLRRAQQRLRIAKMAAEAGSSAKASFLSQVSHEIRNPLTAIMGAIDLLELPADAKIRAARIALLRRSSLALLHLVDDVLDFSKIESGHIEIKPSAIDPIALVEDIEECYRPMALERGIELYLELDPNTPRMVRVDALRIRQVLVNMITNALKFTTEGSVTIEVSATKMEDGQHAITFGVEDTGIGIPDEFHAHIFEPYMQAERSTTEEYGGTGLGLSICSRLITLMAGQLGFETEVGEGTRFWFTLPADMAANTSEDLRLQPLSHSGGAHVLVVEDDPLNRQVVGDLLHSLGHKVRVAKTGSEGIAMYIKNQPDLVLMDIQMPNLNGIQASAQIREWEAANNVQRTPILAMTADVEVHRVARYGEAGMNDLLGKPISREKLEKAVNGWAVQHQE